MAKDKTTAELEILLEASRQQARKQAIRIQQIEEINKNKEAHLQSEIAKYRHIEDSARNLCIKILGKDRREMVLGVSYTWNSVGTEELIQDALKSYKDYCEDRTQALQRLHDYAMTYARDLADAKSEIQRLTDEIDPDAIGNDKDQAVTTEKINTAVKNYYQEKSRHLEEGYKNGSVIYENEEEGMRGELVSDARKLGAKAITDELVSKANQRMANSENRKPSDRTNKEIQKEHEQIDSITPDVKAQIAMLSPAETALLLTTGEGISLSKEIIEQSKVPDSSAYRGLEKLAERSFVEIKDVKYPGVSKAKLIYLTLTGKQAYKQIQGEYPNEPECFRIKRFHARYEHGYGIRACFRLLQESKRYSRLTMFQRAVDLHNGNFYQPDIVGVIKKEDGTSIVDYFEYELGNQTDQEYFAKINKMTNVTDEINFIVPTTTDHNKIHKVLYKWAQEHKNDPNYSKKYIRLSSYQRIKQKIDVSAAYEDWWFKSGYPDDFPKPDFQ